MNSRGVNLAALWLALASIETVLHLVNAESALSSRQLPYAIRLGLLGFDLLSIWILIAAASAAWSLVRYCLSKRQALLSLCRRTLTFCFWIFLVLYGATWGLFYAASSFLNKDSLLFWAAQPIQILHWVPPGFTFGTLAGAAIVAWALAELLPRKVPLFSPGWKKSILFAVLALTVFCLGAVLVAEATVRNSEVAVTDPSRGATYSMERLYRVCRNNRSGPFAHVLMQFAGSPLEPAVPFQPDMRLSAVRPSLISMEQYLAGASKKKFRPLNVVVIVIESMRADILQPYGGSGNVMRTLESLAGEGRVFRNAYAQASHSDYSSPVPIVSQYPLRSSEPHIYPEPPGYPRVLIYEVLKALGYRTAIFSSQNEQWGKMINYHRIDGLDRFFHAETFDGPTYVMLGDIGMSNWVKQTGHAGSVDDRFTVQEAIRWIQSLPGQPWFLSLNLQNAHFPYVIPPDFPMRFGPARLDFPMLFGHFPRRKIPEVRGRYADSLAYVDQQVGTLVDFLKEKGLWEETVVVVTADHGQAFYEHGFATHAGKLYDEVVRVPLIVRGPGVEPALHDRPVQHVDIAPTLLNLLHLPEHPGFQGKSIWEGGSKDGAIYMVAQTGLAHQYAVVRNGYKLIYDVREGLYFLYDLSSDPAERIELSFRRPHILGQLAGRLHRWQQEQIEYYRDRARQSDEFPPVLLD